MMTTVRLARPHCIQPLRCRDDDDDDGDDDDDDDDDGFRYFAERQDE